MFFMFFYHFFLPNKAVQGNFGSLVGVSIKKEDILYLVKAAIIIPTIFSILIIQNTPGNCGMDADIKPGALLQPSPEEVKSSAKVYFNQGMICCEKGLWEKAIHHFTKVIDLNSEYSRAYYYRGIAYCKNRQMAQGIKDFTRAIELEPGFAKAYYYRGVAYKLKKQYKKAVVDFNSVLKLKPDDKKALKGKQAIEEVIK